MNDDDMRIRVFHEADSLNDAAAIIGISACQLSTWYKSKNLSYRDKKRKQKNRNKILSIMDIDVLDVSAMPMNERLRIRHFVSMLHNAHDRLPRDIKPDVWNFVRVYRKFFGDGRKTFTNAEQ